MSLPRSLLAKLEEAFTNTDKLLVQAERHRLTHQYLDQVYTDPDHTSRIQNIHQRLSYLATRVPATYAVCHYVLDILASYDLDFKSLLDLGAGPGTASICASYIFPELETLTLLDQDAGFKEFAHAFLAPKDITYRLQNLADTKSFSAHDLVVTSYALNELSEAAATHVVHQAWLATKGALVIIEPGTPKAFTRLKRLREELIGYGAKIAAPCPHQNPCPLSNEDWCHFAVRLERTSLHKYIKEATLPFEDEKFSYLIALKGSGSLPPAGDRIIKRPLKRQGHILVDLCTSNGLQRRTLSKKDKDLYKRASKLRWGDILEP